MEGERTSPRENDILFLFVGTVDYFDLGKRTRESKGYDHHLARTQTVPSFTTSLLDNN